TESAEDLQNDADPVGKRCRLLRRPPAADTRELPGELRVGVARNRELDDRTVGAVDPTGFGGAQAGDELTDLTERGVAIADFEQARYVRGRDGQGGGWLLRSRGLTQVGARSRRRLRWSILFRHRARLGNDRRRWGLGGCFAFRSLLRRRRRGLRLRSFRRVFGLTRLGGRLLLDRALVSQCLSRLPRNVGFA